jgi:hypothetical protein
VTRAYEFLPAATLLPRNWGGVTVSYESEYESKYEVEIRGRDARSVCSGAGDGLQAQAAQLDLIVTMDDATSTIYSAFLVERTPDIKAIPARRM